MNSRINKKFDRKLYRYVYLEFFNHKVLYLKMIFKILYPKYVLKCYDTVLLIQLMKLAAVQTQHKDI